MFTITAATPMEVIEAMEEESVTLLQDIVTLHCVLLCREQLSEPHLQDIVDSVLERLVGGLEHSGSELHRCAHLMRCKL